MTTHDYNIANQSYAATRADINTAFLAIASNNSNATAPATTFAYMWWYDTTANILKQRNAANNAWIDIGYFDQTAGKFVARIHETLVKSAAYTTVALDRNKTILANATGASFTVTLLPAATAGSGFVQTIKKTDASANTVIVDPNGAETADGAATITLSAQYDFVTLISDGTNWHKIAATASSASLSHGQCRLTKAGANIVLLPYSGNKIVINGISNTVPSAGVSLAPTGLTPSTLYYIYAYMNSGTMTLEASATGHSTDTTTGVEIKTGDATRTLVGMVRPIAGPAFADTAAQRFVLSYFNRKGIDGHNYYTVSRTCTSPTYIEPNTEIRCEFLTWLDESVISSINGLATASSGGFIMIAGIAYDGVTPEDGAITGLGTASNGQCNVSHPKSGLTEGYHYATLGAKVSGSTLTLTGAASGPDRTSMSIMLRG